MTSMAHIPLSVISSSESTNWLSDTLSDSEWKEMVLAANTLMKPSSLLQTKLMNIIQSMPSPLKKIYPSPAASPIPKKQQQLQQQPGKQQQQQLEKQPTLPRIRTIVDKAVKRVQEMDESFDTQSDGGDAIADGRKKKRKKNIVEGVRRCCYCSCTETPMWRYFIIKHHSPSPYLIYLSFNPIFYHKLSHFYRYLFMSLLIQL